jgi:ATP phosphoribosyltransferase regulatory subunit
MISDRWLLPEGVEEVLPLDAGRLEDLRRRLLDLFSSWGYELVIPPFIEYLESLLVGTGRDLDLQTFKLTDQLTGRLMGIRADMTPQVARIEAHHLRGEGVVRLCYMGTVLHTLPNGLTRTRSPVQVGAELYGHGGFESDFEVASLMLETLAAAGVGDVHLDLGHVGVFRGLARQAGLGPEEEAALHDALQRKARAEIGPLLEHMPGASSIAAMVAELVDLNGDESVLARARNVLAGGCDEVLHAVDRLEQLAGEIRGRLPDLPLHFDLAELRGYRYHTGVVFAALVPGHGQEIARGGRYDEIGSAFGHARPATGFSTDLKGLASLGAIQTQSPARDPVLAPWSRDAELLAQVKKLREAGERVIQELPQSRAGSRRPGTRRLQRDPNGSWRVTDGDEQT